MQSHLRLSALCGKLIVGASATMTRPEGRLLVMKRGQEIIRRRNAVGLRADRLAELVGMTPFMLSRIEHNTRAVYPDEYVRLDGVLSLFEHALEEAKRLMA